MPINCPEGKPKYRWRKLKGGKKQRLGFCGNKVVEVKSESGKVKKLRYKK
jgi:hypothetical protein